MTYEGKVVLNYKLTKKLGEGGFGAVYLAEQVDLGRRAAIKILHHQFASQPAVVERFFREARAVCEIGHRAIVTIENFGRLETGEPFYLMEFFAGGAINQITTERWLTSDQLVAIFDPISDALGAAHGKNIIHRDLKPDNIMVRIANDRVADVRLLDFGIAKLLDGDASKSQTGSAMGTPSYMPPEQALDAKNVDARADVYSFGATVYAAVCGRPPFDGSSVAAILLAVQQSTAPLLSTMRPDTTPELDAAIRRCLAKHPDHRPRSIIDAWSAIRTELGRANLSANPAQPNPQIAATMAHTPVPMAIATPMPAVPKTTAAAPSAPVAIPSPAPRAKPLAVDHVMEQAATTPEVPTKSRRALVLGLVALAAVFAVVVIVVAKMSGSGSATSASLEPVTGDAVGGTLVRVTHDRGVEGIAVYFGERKGSVMRTADSLIVVEAPPGTPGEVVDITVAFSSGKPVVLEKAFSYRGSTTARLDATPAIADAAPAIADATPAIVDSEIVADPGVIDAGVATVVKPLDAAVAIARVHADARVKACRNREPVASTPGVSFTVSVSIDVERGGKVTAVRVEGGSADFVRCMQDAITRITLKPSSNGGTISTKFKFGAQRPSTDDPKPTDPKPTDPKPQPGCSEASFAPTNAKTEADVEAMLSRLNGCQGKLGGATFNRLQQALVQRKLSL